MKKLGLLALSMIAPVQAIDYQFVDDSATGYDNLGFPTERTNVNDSLPTDILNDIYNMLPETQPVNPSFISQDILTNIHIDGEVGFTTTASITFFNEGAGYRNSLGYFIYQTNNPPASIDDIPTHTIIFPNASKSDTGDTTGPDLKQGDTVELGIELLAGQSIGFFLIPNGWAFYGEQVTGQNMIPWNGPWDQPFYSLEQLNPETDTTKRHNVVFIDPQNELLVIGFDDQLISYGDRDYNDVLFAVNVTPFENIDGVNADGSIGSGYVPLEGDSDDTDVPTSTTSYYPTKNGFATLMFEDLWPEIGDYDFNDLIVKYNMERTLSGQGTLQRLQANYQVQARGAAFHNGFALRLPGIDASYIGDISVTRNGNPVDHDIIEQAASDLVIVLSPDITVDISSSCPMYRTLESCKEDINTTISLDVTFSTPPSANVVGLPPYDPFIFGVKDTYHGNAFPAPPGRSWELHLKQFAGTNLFDNSYFNMVDDNSDGVNNNFVTSANMPWVINITSSFDHVSEYIDISHAYPLFPQWVNSGGFQYTDWHETSNADVTKLYQP